MGVQIVRVPPDYKHPVDSNGDYIDGAHLEPLWYMTAEQKPCFQIYQNVSEGTPIIPIFRSGEEVCKWMVAEGESQEAAEEFLRVGHAPGLVISSSGPMSGPQGLVAAKAEGPK